MDSLVARGCCRVASQAPAGCPVLPPAARPRRHSLARGGGATGSRACRARHSPVPRGHLEEGTQQCPRLVPLPGPGCVCPSSPRPRRVCPRQSPPGPLWLVSAGTTGAHCQGAGPCTAAPGPARVSPGQPGWPGERSRPGRPLTPAPVPAPRDVVCVACEKRTLSVFSACGRRLLPPILLPSPISTLHCTGAYVMALTAAATLSVWDVHRQEVVVKEESLHSILAGVHGALGGWGGPGQGWGGGPASRGDEQTLGPLLRGLVPAEWNTREPSACLPRKRHDGVSDLADAARDPRDEPVGRQGLLLQPVIVHMVSAPPRACTPLSALWGPVGGARERSRACPPASPAGPLPSTCARRPLLQGTGPHCACWACSFPEPRLPLCPQEPGL